MTLEKRFIGEPVVFQVPMSLVRRRAVFDRLMLELSQLGLGEISDLEPRVPSTLERDVGRALDGCGITDATERDVMLQTARLMGRV